MVKRGQVDTLQVLPSKLPYEVNQPYCLEALKLFDHLNSNGKKQSKMDNMPESLLSDELSNSYYLTWV